MALSENMQLESAPKSPRFALLTPHTAGERLLKGVEAAVTVVRTWRVVEAGKTEGAGSSQNEKGAQSVTEEGWPLHAHAAKVADSWAKEVRDQIKTFSKNTEEAAPHPQV